MPVNRTIAMLAGIAAVLILLGLVLVAERDTRPMADRLVPVVPADLPGWTDDAVSHALPVLARSCEEIINRGRGFAKAPRYGGRPEDWYEACHDLLALDFAHMDNPEARKVLERQFDFYRVVDATRPAGLFTGYFEPEVEGSLVRTAEYTVPVYRNPDDLVRFDVATRETSGLGYGRNGDNGPVPYFTRREIDQGALADRGLELLWLKSWADLFFMQIQGSGRVRLPDDDIVRLSYAAKNGRAYTAIGGILADRGDIHRDKLSMQAIRHWMDAHPDEARELMWRNDSYVFFAAIDVTDPTMGPPGAQLAGLTAGRSLAVDPSYWAYGTPVFLSTTVPTIGGGSRSFRHLLIAQDTGSAIRGLKRGDIFFGSGDEAAWAAGHMKAPAEMYVLLPKGLGTRLDLGNGKTSDVRS